MSIFWYQAGKSAGYSSGEADGYDNGVSEGYEQGRQYGFAEAKRLYDIRDANDYNAGYRRIHINAHNSWVDECNRLQARIKCLEKDVESLEKDLQRSKECTDEARREDSRHVTYYTGLANCLTALHKAAEQGKTHYPEYAALKTAVQQMRDAFVKKEIIFKADALGPYIVSLLEALDR